jgi:DNA-binding transcriptional regulator GbsR (MarR family)
MKKSELKQLIKEEIRKVLSENKDIVDKILDKISQYGINSLTYTEKEYLDKYSKDDKDLKAPYSLANEDTLYSPKTISYVKFIIARDFASNNIPSPKLQPLEEWEKEELENLPGYIKNYFPLKKGDYQKLDTFFEVVWDKITGGEEFYSFISTLLGPTALIDWEQTVSALMITYLDQNKFITPEITLQYHNTLVDRYM